MWAPGSRAPSVAISRLRLEPERVAGLVAARGPRAAPAWPAAGRRAVHLGHAVAVAGVEAQAGDHDEGMARIRVDRDPLALAGLAPGHEVARVERGVEQPGAVQRIAHGAGAVVAPRDEGPVPAAVDIRLGDD